MAALAPHLPEADTLRLAEHYRDGFVAQRAAGGAEAHAPLYPGALAALERLAGRPRDAARRRHRQGAARARPRLRRRTASPASSPPPRPPTTTPRSRIPRCCSRRSPRPAARRPTRSMVGDTEFDIAMGRAAGLATVGVAWGYHPRERLRRRRRRRRHRRLRRARRRARPARGRRAMTLGPRRRFWRRAHASGPRPAASPSTSTTRPLRTPAGAPLVVPTAALAARDRRRVGRARGRDRPRPPAADPRRQLGDRPGRARSARRWSTRSPSTAAPTCSATAPPSPPALAARQAAGWDPWLAWAARALGAPLVAVDRRDAPAPAAAEPRGAAARRSPRRTPSGSRRCTSSSRSPARWCSASRSPAARSTPRAAWELSRIDETWQAEQWGLDAEAEAAAERRRADFLQRRGMLALLERDARTRSCVNPGRDDAGQSPAASLVEPDARRLTFRVAAHKSGDGGEASALETSLRGRDGPGRFRGGGPTGRGPMKKTLLLGIRRRAGAWRPAPPRRPPSTTSRPAAR